VRSKGLQRRNGKIGVMDFSRGSNRIRNSKYMSLLYTCSTPPLLIKSYKIVETNPAQQVRIVIKDLRIL